MPGTSKLRRRACLAGTAATVALALTGCDKPATQPSSTLSSHDSAWIESAIAQVGTQAGHDPVVKVEIDPAGTTVTTRRADSRVQRQWRVSLAGSGATPGVTLSPSPSPTPRATARSTASGQPSGSTGAAATASATTTSASASSGRAPASGTRSSASASGRGKARPAPVFVTPSGSAAAPLSHPAPTDNTLGNMGLGAFGDTQVLPMWTLLQNHHCAAGDWRMVLTSGWSGLVVNHATCGSRRFVQVNGQSLPSARTADARLDQQLSILASLLPGPVARLDITRTGNRTCPTQLVADYRVELSGTVNLRTTLSCSDVTTQQLGPGWLPSGGVGVSAVHAKQVQAVFRALAARHHAATALVVQYSQLYGEAVMVPATSTNGRPAYGLDGVLKK